MKNYKKVYAAFILAGGLILHGCNGIFDVRPLLMTQ